jgi:hypothetical protein
VMIALSIWRTSVQMDLLLAENFEAAVEAGSVGCYCSSIGLHRYFGSEDYSVVVYNFPFGTFSELHGS